MNNQIKNNKTEVSTGTNLNDKDYDGTVDVNNTLSFKNGSKFICYSRRYHKCCF